MGGVWYRAKADLRRGVGGTLLLVLLVAFAGGVTLAALAGARRTRDALPTFLEYNHAPNSAVYVDPSLPADEQATLLGEAMDLPLWDGAAVVASVGVSVRGPDDEDLVLLGTDIREAEYPLELSRPIIVAGGQPDPEVATDAVINEAMADGLGLEVGDEFELRSITAARLEEVGNGQLRTDPDGTPMSMTVRAIVRQPTDLREAAAPRFEGVFAPDSWTLTLTPAWWTTLDGDVASYGSGVLGHVAPGSSQDDLNRAVAAIDQEHYFVEGANEDDQTVRSIRRATDFEAAALLVFAAVVAVAGLALVGQVLARQVGLRLDDGEYLRASGLVRRQRAAVAVPRLVLVAGLGAVGAAGLAVALSPLAPVGLARRAELDPGVHVDPVVVVTGGLTLALLVVGWGAAVAWRHAATEAARDRRPDRPSVVGGWLTVVGASVPVVAGVRLALERGRGRTAVPVISTLLAGTAGVLMVTAVLTFSFSLTHLVDTPALQGWNWDVVVGNYSRQDAVDAGSRALRDNPAVAAYLGENVQGAGLDGHPANVATIGPGDPSIGPPVIEGRRPDADDEIALGRRTLAELDKGIGDTVTVSADSGSPPIEATIVGTVILPAGINDSLTLGDGALMTLEGLRNVYGPQGDLTVAQSFLVTFADGFSRADGIESLRTDFGDTVVVATPPDDVKNLRRVQGLPGVLALTVGLLAVGTLANTLVTCIRRRRRDLATFATLGLRPRQVAATVAVQATTVALLSLVVGLPLGVAAGRTVWTLVMTSIGTSVPAVTPWAALAGLAVAIVVGANVIAALPGRAAARLRPAVVLRSE